MGTSAPRAVCCNRNFFCRLKRQTPHSSPGAGFWILRLVLLLRRALTRTSGANKYKGKKKERATHANSLNEKAGSEIALAAALRHIANVNDARMPVNTCGQRNFMAREIYAGEWTDCARISLRLDGWMSK
ncbi:hypothetical protein [Rudaea sp.]|uniref:hypothetical protein n=1 Tax=Rudaea sp. TaxID=2136325 RepID=UPI00321FF821